MAYQERTIESADGRVLQVATMGDPSRPPVFFHHGTPGSASLVRTIEEIATKGDLYLVTMSRAGYGTSTRQPGRTVAAAVPDTRTVLDALGLDRYAVVGWSGGGPHALACAALDAPRCIAAWSLAGVAPFNADFDWTDGMGPENIEEMELAVKGGPEYEAHMEMIGTAFGDATAENVIDLFGGLLSDPDKETLAPLAPRELFVDSLRQGFVNGWRGFYDDDRAMMSDWGFEPSAITIPVSVWFGDQDLMVPPTHAQWLLRAIPDSIGHHYGEEGHLSIIANHFDELAAEIKKAFA
jgi:pimeloyl-ACP methyl ester carboxylesterase